MATKKLNILWLDDDIDIFDEVTRPMREQGCKFKSIRSKKEFLEEIDRLNDYNLVILDIIIPEGEIKEKQDPYPGLSVLETIKQRTPNLPVLVLTVVTNKEVLEKIKELRVAGLIRKPVLPSDLENVVNSVTNS